MLRQQYSEYNEAIYSVVSTSSWKLNHTKGLVRFVQGFFNYYTLTYLLLILLAVCLKEIKHILWRETGFHLSLFVKMTVTYTNIFRPTSSYCSVIFHTHKWIAFEVWATKVVPNHNSDGYCLAKQKALMMPTDQIIQISKEQRWKIKQKLQWPWGGCGCHTHTHKHYCICEERYKYLL